MQQQQQKQAGCHVVSQDELARGPFPGETEEKSLGAEERRRRRHQRRAGGRLRRHCRAAEER